MHQLSSYDSAISSRILAVLATAAALAAPAGATPCATTAFNAITPGSGVPGDTILLSGDGFCAPTSSFLAWGTNGTRGFAFTAQSNNLTTIQAELAPVHVATAGPVRLWIGQKVPLPDAVLETSHGLYHRSDASIFLPVEQTIGPSFSAQVGSESGLTSTLVNGELRINFASGPASPLRFEGFGDALQSQTGKQVKGGGEQHISVMVVLSTGSSGGSGGGCEPEPDPASTPPTSHSWAAHFELACFGPSGDCTTTLAEPMAQVLGSTLDSLCMAARLEGSTVVLSHRRNHIERGFVSLTVH